jgi:hypothetical protein
MPLRKWVYFALAGDWNERMFCVKEYCEMSRAAGIPISDTRIYNAIRLGELRGIEPAPPHNKIRVVYSDFIIWFKQDPLQMICVNERARHREGMMKCQFCSEPILPYYKFCPECGRANRYASVFNKLDFTEFHSSTMEDRRAS